MFCSTVIPTVGRSTLSRAVYSVLDQTFTADDFEVIVVNDSGRPLPEADWQQANRVWVINTNRRELCVARNSGAAIAKGRYLHFLDDDDWLLPNALENFWTLVQRNEAAIWLYGGARFEDETGKNLGELNLKRSGNCFTQLIAGSWIPAQVSLIQTEKFFAMGGFNPLFGPTEEMELGRRLALRGELAHTSDIVACILRGRGWVTTADHDLHPEYNRWSRDIALSEPGSFARMYASANSSYWHGRIFHAYLTTTLWNLRRKRFLTAASRTVYGIASLTLSARHIPSSDFWRSVRDTQVPCSQARVIKFRELS